jgi:threonine dehydratase
LREVLARTGAVEIHPFENPQVIAGAGTAAQELLEEVPDVDVVITPIGGGGLCSGTCVAVGGRARVIGASPVDRGVTIADGLRTGTSPVTDAIITAEQVTVPEAAIVEAMRDVWERAKQVIEPSAAVAFAAARAAQLDGQRVAIICSGGNVDLDALPWRPTFL